jgi:FkbM family methyltransferase
MFWRQREATLPKEIAGFDREYYLKQYPDVAESGMDPMEHYLLFGWKEARNPSEFFDSTEYLAAHPDVAEAGMNPLEHFLKHGMSEGRLLGELKKQNAALGRLSRRRGEQYALALENIEALRAENEKLRQESAEHGRQAREARAHCAAAILAARNLNSEAMRQRQQIRQAHAHSAAALSACKSSGAAVTRILRRLEDEITESSELERHAAHRERVGQSPETSLSLAVMAPETAAFHAMSTDRALGKLKDRGITLETVIDVGASNGMWAAICEKHFPNARYLLVEAQMAHRRELESYCGARGNSEFVIAAAGNAPGTIYFDDSALFGGVASKQPTESAKTKVQQITLDAEAKARSLPGPYLLKLDTHGYEIPILEGSRELVLPNAALLVIETYNFDIAPESLRFEEMVSYLRRRGFGVIDISEPLWRKRDGALWQFDLFFVPLSHPEFLVNTYS